MSLIIPPGFGNAAFTFSSDAGTPEFVTTMGLDISGFAGDWVTAANAAFSCWVNAMSAVTDSSLTLDRVTLAVGQDGPGGSVDSNLAPVAMTRGSATSIMSSAAVARKVTNEIGRRGRGRMFLPGSVGSNEIDEGGNISSGRITSLNTALIAFLDEIETGGDSSVPMEAVLLHSSAPTEPTPIVSLAVSTLVGWVRGRIR